MIAPEEIVEHMWKGLLEQWLKESRQYPCQLSFAKNVCQLIFVIDLHSSSRLLSNFEIAFCAWHESLIFVKFLTKTGETHFESPMGLPQPNSETFSHSLLPFLPLILISLYEPPYNLTMAGVMMSPGTAFLCLFISLSLQTQYSKKFFLCFW